MLFVSERILAAEYMGSNQERLCTAARGKLTPRFGADYGRDVHDQRVKPNDHLSIHNDALTR